MMDQFHELKEANQGTILFFRMGDFYELFHDDAEVGSNVLGLALTSRDKNADEPCLLYTSPSPRDVEESRMPSSA